MDYTRWLGGFKPCNFCGTSNKKNLRCGDCESVYYCSKEHQKLDWKSHCGSCRYYKVIQEPSKASYLVATREIPKGTILIKSEALAVGPSGVEPVCLGCLRPMIYDTLSYQCEGCGWPIDVQCRHSRMHQLECSALQKAGFHLDEKELWKDWRKEFPLPAFCFVLLRILLSNQSAKLLKLYRPEDHNHFDKTFLELVSTYIRNSLKLQQYDHDTISTLTKVVLRASVSVTVLDETFSVLEMRYGMGVHDSDIAHLQHSCFPNVNILETLAEPKVSFVVANVDIARGDTLTAYKKCQNFYGSTGHRQLGPFNFLDLCTCLRCRDPTELGLYLQSVTCKKCSGMITPALPHYECQKCHFILTLEQMGHLDSALCKSMQLATKRPKDLVKFIDDQSGPKGLLHPNHYLIHAAKDAFCNLIHENSFKKGAAYKFGLGDLDRVHNFTKDLMARNAKLNQHGKVLHIRWLKVHSRYILCQWFVGNITSENALELIHNVLAEDVSYGMPEPVDRHTAVLHRNMIIELCQHLARIQDAIRIAQED